MVKVMPHFPAARIHVSALLFIICTSTASSGPALHIEPKMEARCGENLTLTCETTESESDIQTFELFAQNTPTEKCSYNKSSKSDKYIGRDVLCKTMRYSTTISLTLINVMPVNQGEYLCKIRSNTGVNSRRTVVEIQDCIGFSLPVAEDSDAKCSFSGVYPEGVIHWFQGETNLTDSTYTEQNKDQHGRYNVWSTIKLQKENHMEPYKCKLWISSKQKYLTERQIPLKQQIRSSGGMEKLHWLLLILEIMVLRFIM